MSTAFNPQIPTDQDSVYDAYFAFRQNMESINNLINVDHFNGSSPAFHGNHRRVNLPEPLDTDPKPTGDLGVLYTKVENGVARLKFANKTNHWLIPLGEQPGGGGGGGAQSDGPSFIDPITGLTQSGDATGHAIFPNKFCMVWFRFALEGNATHYENFPIPMKRIFSCILEYGDATYASNPITGASTVFQFRREHATTMSPPNYILDIKKLTVFNRNKTTRQSIQAFVVGEAM